MSIFTVVGEKNTCNSLIVIKDEMNRSYLNSFEILYNVAVSF